MLRALRISGFVVVSSLLLSASAYAALLTDRIDLSCAEDAYDVLSCEYRTLAGVNLDAVYVQSGETRMRAKLLPYKPSSDTPALTMFVVDTSNSARQRTIQRNREHVAQFLHVGGANYDYGLAKFDADLAILCAPPCAEDEMVAQLEHIIPGHNITEMYRNIVTTIKLLRAADANYKQIVLMSDGTADDVAYHHQDVIRAATEARVVINTLGYPAANERSVALQNLRRLSEETGGMFALPNSDEDSFNEIAKRMLDYARPSGRFQIPLRTLSANRTSDIQTISLELQTDIETLELEIPVTLSEAANDSEANGPPDNSRSKSISAGDLLKRYQLHGGDASWFWYGLPVLVFLSFLITALAYAGMLKRRQEERKSSPPVLPDSQAYLLLANDRSRRYTINQTPWRIGRSRSNDLTLEHTSVSRLHAEIRRDAFGQFTVHDLESLNGVIVNGEQISQKHLAENDRVEIGDVGFVFSQLDDDDPTNSDTTVMARPKQS